MTTLAGLILAGGRSSRMGSDKSAVTVAGKPLLARVVERLSPQVANIAISANAPVDAHGLTVLADPFAGHPGPLAGVLAGLEWAASQRPASDYLVTVPVDAPFFPADLVARLVKFADGRAIVSARSEGRAHPVFSLWPVSFAPLLRLHMISGGTPRMLSLVESQPHRFVDFESVNGIDPFTNINTPEDLAAAEISLLNEPA